MRLENVAEIPFESAVAQMATEENPLIEFEKRLHKDAGLRQESSERNQSSRVVRLIP